MTPRYVGRRRVTRHRGIATSRTTGVVGDTVARGSKTSASCHPTLRAQPRCGWTARRAIGTIRRAAQAAQQSTVAQKLGVGSLNAEPLDLGVARLNAEVWTLEAAPWPPSSSSLHSESAGSLFVSPHGPHETLTPKCDSRCPNLVSRSFLEVMVPPLLQSIRVDVLALSLIMWNHGCMVFWYMCICICKMYGLG